MTKPAKLYLLSSYSDDIRPRPASVDEIGAVLDGIDNSRLATIALSDDGQIVTHLLGPAELDALRAELVDRHRTALITALDVALVLVRLTADMRGVTGSDAMRVWPAEFPWAETVVREWAAERGLVVHDEQMPSSGKTWIRTSWVTLSPKSYERVVTLQWPSVAIGEAAIAVEVMSHAVAAVGSDAEAF